MDNNGFGSKVDFSRGEKTVLIDALKWYLDYSEDSIFVEELSGDKRDTLKNMIKNLEKDGTCEIDSDLGSFIVNDIIPDFGQELKEQIGLPEVENKEETGDFYRTQFEGIAAKIKEAKKQQNPFF